jgi:hypothetical protein
MYIYIQRITVTPNDAQITPVVVIEEPVSLIWVTRFNTPGEFELYVPATTELFSLIKTNMGKLIVTRSDKTDIMYIEYIKLIESEETGDYLIIKGRTIDCIMEKRVIGYPTTFNNIAYHTMILQLIRENLSAPTVVTTDYPADPLTRKISPVQVQSSVVNVSYGSAVYHGENLLAVVDQILQLKGYGLRAYLSQGEIIFDIYEGRDRTWVVISPRTDMILSSEYEYSIRGQCNAAFVYAEGDPEHIRSNGTNPYTVTRQYPSTGMPIQYARNEGYTTGSAATTETGNQSVTNWEQGGYNGRTGEAYASESEIRCPDYINSGRRISVTWTLTYGADVTYCTLLYYGSDGEFLSSSGGFENGETVSPPANAKTFRINLYKNQYLYHIAPEDVISVTLTALRDKPIAAYKAEIAEQGAALMTAPSETFAAEVSETGLYQIGTHYTLGDTVTLENSYGVSGTAKVSEITESISADGRHIYPTFTDWTPTTQQEG